MKKILLTLAAAVVAVSTMMAQEPVQEPNPVATKNPTGLDVPTGVLPADRMAGRTDVSDVKATQQVQRKTTAQKSKVAAKQTCQKAAKAQGKSVQVISDKAAITEQAPTCDKSQTKAECHKAGEACTKPADQKCDKCKEADKKQAILSQDIQPIKRTKKQDLTKIVPADAEETTAAPTK